MAGELTNWTPGTPNTTYPTKVNSYKGLLHFVDNAGQTASLQAIADGLGNSTGIKISDTQISIEKAFILSSLTASKLVYLNASNILTTIADGTVGQALVTNGAGVYSFATIAGGGGITINSTAITSGTAGRILFENASNQVSEAAGLTYSSGLFTVLGTTQQAKFAYDASNHLGITIASNGSATYALTGTTPVNIFNQYIGIGKTPTDPIDIATNISGSGNGANISFNNSHSAGWASTKVINNLNDYCYYGIAGSTVATYGAITARDAVLYTGRNLTLAVDGSNSIKFATGVGALQRMVIDGSGNVGIGRATPNARLHTLSTTEQFRSAYDASNFASFTTASNGDLTIGLTGTTPTVKFSTKVQLSDVDLILGTTTGSKIGSTSSQKLAFWGKTPIVQPTTAIARTVHTSVGGTVINDNDTFGGYTLDQAITALINCGILA